MSCHEKISSGQYLLVMAYLRNPKAGFQMKKISNQRWFLFTIPYHFPVLALSCSEHMWDFNVMVWTPAAPLSVNSFQDSKPPASRNVQLQSCVLAVQLEKTLLDFTVCLPPALLRTLCSGVTNGWNTLLGRVSTKYKEPEKNELTVCAWNSNQMSYRIKTGLQRDLLC